MIRLRIKIKSLSGEAYTNDEELDDNYMVSRQNSKFNQLIEANIERSHLKEIDYVKVTAYFGEI